MCLIFTISLTGWTCLLSSNPAVLYVSYCRARHSHYNSSPLPFLRGTMRHISGLVLGTCHTMTDTLGKGILTFFFYAKSEESWCMRILRSLMWCWYDLSDRWCLCSTNGVPLLWDVSRLNWYMQGRGMYINTFKTSLEWAGYFKVELTHSYLPVQTLVLPVFQ